MTIMSKLVMTTTMILKLVKSYTVMSIDILTRTDTTIK